MRGWGPVISEGQLPCSPCLWLLPDRQPSSASLETLLALLQAEGAKIEEDTEVNSQCRWPSSLGDNEHHTPRPGGGASQAAPEPSGLGWGCSREWGPQGRGACCADLARVSWALGCHLL